MRLLNSKRMGRCLASAIAMMLVTTAAAAEFPFERELLLEAKPLPGSKRVPMLEIRREGRAIIDLWCKSGGGRVEVSGETVKITIEAMKVESCTPERTERDEALATALAAVTQWRMEDDVLVLIGPTELRYTLSSH
jgi:heat shock protein HslJ